MSGFISTNCSKDKDASLSSLWIAFLKPAFSKTCPTNELEVCAVYSSFFGDTVNTSSSDTLSFEQLVEINPDIIVYMRDDIDTTIYTEWKDTELYKSLDAVKNNKVYTTVARGPWTQYRGFISVNTLTKEMSGWLLNN